MYYRMYLSSVCVRRQWPDPQYEPFRDRRGYHCKVKVNNREYCTEVPYQSEDLAQENAAMQAYLICRNFSYNDGMYPGQRPGQSSSNGSVQGLPVAIGSGRRRSNRTSYGSSSADDTSSGGNSPKSMASGDYETQMRQVTHQVPSPAGPLPQLPQRKRSLVQDHMCYCRRAPIRAYGRCEWCLSPSA